MCAGGQTDDERRKRHQRPMKGWEAERDKRVEARQKILWWPSEVLKAEPRVDEATVVKGVGAEERRAPDQKSSKVEVNSRPMIDGGGKRKNGRKEKKRWEGGGAGGGGSNPRLQTSHHRAV